MKRPERFWEIDSLRGIAIILMLASNLVTDVGYFRLLEVDAHSGFWLYLARLVVSMFIVLAGVSLTLSYSRVRDKGPGEIHRKYLLRGARIFLWGMAITLVTWIFIPRDFVLFGILHLIGASIILGHFFLKKVKIGLLLGIALFLAGIYLQGMTFDFPWLSWLGFRPQGYYSVDYVPLLPWFGLFLMGMSLGSMLFPDGKRRFKIKDYSGNMLVVPISFLGRNSLKIYLMHQPILLLAVWLLLPLPDGFPF
jgi:uncharacterized membrane protein